MRISTMITGAIMLTGIIMFTGCVSSVPVNMYTPPKANTPSSAISGNHLRIKYDLDGTAATTRGIYYHIYDTRNNKLLASTWLPGKKAIEHVFGTTQNISILGMLGDKVVFVWKNGAGFADAYLSVYDFSDKRTYNLLQNNEKFSILQRGNSYVVTTQNKAISLNSLKEVRKKSLNGYRKLSLKYNTGGLDSRHTVSRTHTEFTPDEAYFYIKTEANTYGKLTNLMFGTNRRLYRANLVH